MAAHRRVYGFGHLCSDCRGPGSAPEHYAHFEYGTTKESVTLVHKSQTYNAAYTGGTAWGNLWNASTGSFLQPPSNHHHRKLFVGGLSAATTIEDVKHYFEQYGKVRCQTFFTGLLMITVEKDLYHMIYAMSSFYIITKNMSLH